MATTKRTHAGDPAPLSNPQAIAFAVSVAFLLPNAVFAQTPPPAPNTLPTNGQFVQGTGQILPATPQNYLEVQQQSARGVVNWGSFSIGSAAHVHFQHDAGRAGVTLNRVVGQEMSRIFGKLTADGQIFLVNNAGVYFGRGASVDVGSLFVSSLSIRDQDFMAGRYQFYRDGQAGEVVNEGRIVTANGYAALAGPQVRNDGVIIARAGSVALAAGDRVTLDLIGDGLISISVDQAALNASVVNSGTIQADGGNVLLTASSANALLDTVINTSGIIRANSLAERNGQIVLDGGDAGVVAVTGALQAAGVDAGTTGGTVKVLGKYVGLFENAMVDASGHAGGGTALIGGNWQGHGPERNATRTIVGADATISASATNSGDGGTVVVWSDDVTKFFGSIDARGGAQGGNGGQVETSGKNVLQALGSVDVSAPRGRGGLWLLDPHDITIQDVNTAGITVSGTTDFTSNADNAILDVDDLGAALTGGATVRVITANGGTGTGTITVQDTTTAAGSGSLELHAQGDIIFAAGATITQAAANTLNVSLLAGESAPLTGAGTTPGAITMDATSSIVTGGGNVIAIGQGAVTLGAIDTGAAGTLSVTSNGGAITQAAGLAIGGNANFNAGANTITLNDTNNFGSLTFTGTTVSISEASNTVLSGTSSATTSLSLTSTGSITDDNSANVTVAGNATFSAGANAITLNDTYSFGSLTFAGGAVTIVEANATELSGTSTADSLSLTSGGALTDASGASLTVTNGASFSGTSITLADNADTLSVGANASFSASGGGGISVGAPGTVNFGSLTFSTTGTASVTEDSAMSLDGANSGSTVTLNSSAGISQAGGTLTATTLTGSAATTVSINQAGNAISNLGSFTSAGGFTLVDGSGGLTLTAALNDATGVVSISTSGGTLALGANAVSGTSVELVSNGATGDITSAVGGTITATGTTVQLTAGRSVSIGAAVSATTTADIDFGQSAAGTFTDGAAITGTAVTVTGGANNDTFNLNINLAANLAGAGGDDSFVFANGVTLTGNIDGGAGTDDRINIAAAAGANTVNLDTTTVSGVLTGTFTGVESFTGDNAADVLVGTSVNTTWTITGANDGTLSTGFSFTDIPNVTGGTLDDSFVFNAAGTLNSLDGGTGANSINIAAVVGANTINLVTGTISGVLGTTFANVTSFTGDNTADVLVGTNANTTWTIATANDGTLSTGQSFTNIPNLTGGTQDDSFVFQAAGSLTGLIDGGAHATGDSIDYSALGAITVTLGTGFTNIESLTGNDTNQTLAAAAGTNTFTISGQNDGNVNGTTTFTDFASLQGGTGDDTFTFQAAGSLTGGVNGGGHATADTINIAAVAGANTINLQTGALGGVLGTTFANVESFVGDNAADVLVGTNALTTWTITGANDGTLSTGFSFTDIPNLTGGTANDTFVFQAAGTLAGTLDGGAHTTGDTLDIAAKAGANTIDLTTLTVSGGIAGTITNIESFTGDNAADVLVGTSVNTTWTITGANDGTLSTGFSFTDIPNVTGGTLDDSFVFNAAGTLNSLDGGTGANSINIAAVVGANTINLVTGTISGVLGTTFANVTSFTGDNTADVLVGTNANTTWTIATANDGTLSTGQSFTNIPNLTGGTQDDSFVFQAAGSLTGLIDGGAHATGDSIDYSALGAITVTLGTGFTNIESLTGNDTNQTLAAAAGTNTFTISGQNDGNVNGTTTFTDFASLQGGTGDDTFTFQAAGSLTGGVNGGGHATADTINIAAVAGANTINLQTGALGGVLGTTFANVESFVGDNAADVLVGTNALTTWTITGANDGTLSTGFSFTDIPNLTGGTANDTFVFQAAGTLAGTLDGGAHTTGDTLDIAAKAGANTIDLTTLTVSGGIAGTITNIESFTGDNAADVLVGTSVNTTWTITGANDGTLSTGFSFTDIPNVTGGTLDDSFVFNAAGTLNSLDGGTGANSINIAAVVGANTINLVTGTISGVLGTTFANVTSFTGDNTADVLVGTNANTTWTIATANDGTLSTGQSFTNIPNLTGGTQDDSFVFQAAGSLTGLIDGGAHATGDSIDYSALGAITVTLGTGFTNIESLTGNDTNQTLAAAAGTNTFTISGQNDGNVNGTTTFTDFASLQGGTGDDTFTFQAAGSLTGGVNGGGHATADTINIAAVAGANTINLQTGALGGVLGTTFANVESFVGDNAADVLVGTNALTTWTITGANDGTLSTGFSFTDIPNLTGGTANDTFVFQAAGTLAGTLDGGAHTTGDTLDIAAKAGANTIDLTTLTVSGGIAGTITNIESFTGDNAADVLVGTSVNTTWTITGANDGTLSTGFSFTDIPNVTGGTADDTFVFQAAGTLAGLIDGGAHTTADSINYSALGAITVTLGTGFTNIESLTGNNTNQTLAMAAGTNTFTISGQNDGNVNGTTTFTDFANLQGGTGDDTFTFQAAGSLTGGVNGGTGNNSINIAAVVGANTINLVTGAISGVVNTVANVTAFTGDNTADVLVGTNANTTWTITGANDGTLSTGQSFTDIPNLTGSGGDDSFALNVGTLTGAVNGGAGTNTLTAGNVANTWSISGLNIGSVTGITGGWSNIQNIVGGSVADTFTMAGGSVTSINGGAGTDTLNAANVANTWTLTGANQGTLNGINWSNIENIAGNANTDSFTGGGSVAGTISDGGGGATTLSGTITSGGAQTYTSAVTLAGATTVAAGSATFGSTVTGAFAFTVNSPGATSFANTINVASITTDAGGSTALPATVTTTGNQSFGDAVTAGAITLTSTTGSISAGNGGNDFGGLVDASAPGGITLGDANTLTVGTINASAGSVTLFANAIVEGGGGPITAGSSSAFGSNVIVAGLDISMPGVALNLTGAASQWALIGVPAAPDPVTVAGSNVAVTYNGGTLVASIFQQQAAASIATVSASVTAAITEEANKTFGTDSVAEQIDYGFAGDVGATPPMDHRIDESGISLPSCVQEAREGVPCK